MRNRRIKPPRVFDASLSTNSRTTDSCGAAKPAEFVVSLMPRQAARALIAKGDVHHMLSVVFLFTLRMKRLWVPGFSLALILLPGLGFAETQQSRLFPEAKKIALPAAQ